MSDSVDIEAARVALLALRASIQDDSMTQDSVMSGDVGTRVLVMLGNRLLTTDTAAVVDLASEAKPVSCRLTTHGEDVVIRCSPVTDPQLLAAHNRRAERLEEFWQSALGIDGRAPVECDLILFRSGVGSLASTFGAFQRFLHDYDARYTAGTMELDAQAIALGAIGVILLSSPAPLDLR